MKFSKIVILLFLLLSNFSWANSETDSLKIKRLKNHVSSLDYITRQIDNSKYYLNLNKSYCDSILSIDPSNKFALDFKEKINLTLATCDQNINHKIELFPFFNGFPHYMGFADDPIEYAYDNSLEKLLSSKYPKVENGPISSTNISSIVVRNSCDDEMFEIVNQILLKNTNHYILPKHELEDILGKSAATSLINGNVDLEAVSLLSEKLNLDRLGIFNVNDLDVINNSIWLVQSEFYTFHKEYGFSEPIFTRGFNIDKRSFSIIYILLLLIKSILLIAFISFLNQKLKRIFNSSDSIIKDLWNLFIDKIKFVGISFIVPLIFSFILIYSISYLMPSAEEHFEEFSAKFWLFSITIGMSIIPTIVNLYFVNRMDLDGFHTVKGYRYFANTSLYATYFPLFVFYIIQFETYPITEHFLLIGITLLIGDLLARSYFQFSSVTNNSALKKQGVYGIILGIVALMEFNSIILTELTIANLGLSIVVILPLSIAHYAIGYYLNKTHEYNLNQSSNKTLLSNVPYIKELLNPKDAIFNKIANTISDTELNIMIVSGPAGIGKTRGLLETKELFELSGWDWYYGDCDELQGESAISYEPFLEGFKELLKIEEFTNRGEKMEKSMGKAVNIGAAIMDIDASFIGDYERNTERSISEMCIEIIDKLESRKNKTIFVMEDLHWIDPESYAFLNKFIEMINRNKFLRGNMCIVLSIREESLFDYRGPSLSQLIAKTNDLNKNSSFKFKVEELLNFSNFNTVDFVKHLSQQDNQFKIQNNSLAEINSLLNNSIKEKNMLGQITPLYIFKTLEKWISDGLLKYSPSGYLLTSNIDSDSLPNDMEVDSFYHTIIDQYDEKWQRLLESASTIGNKFNADILTQVWGYELLDVLGFLEKVVEDNLLIDISEEDNIYEFKDKRIISSIKSYFNKDDNSGDKQIIKEYNKRYLHLQNTIIENPHNHSVEEILSIIRRLSSLLINETYLKIAEKLILEVVVRLVKQGEEDKLLGFNAFLISTNKLDHVTELISYLIQINSFSSIHISKLNEIRDEVSVIESKTNSIALDLKLFILFILKNKHQIKSKEFVSLPELEYIKDKIFNEFKGNLQFQFAIEYMLYSYKSAKESIQILKDFYTNVEQKTEEHNQLIELQELKFMGLDSPIKKEEIDERSFKLIEKIKDIKSSSIKFKILKFRLEFLSSILENDEKAIIEFREYNRLLISSEGVNKLWVGFVINFLGSWSASTYIIKHRDEAQEKFLKCENYFKKIIDFRILSNDLIYFTDAKKEVLGNTKKYKELKKVSLDYLKIVKESIGVRNIDYAYACTDLGKVYENLKEGELSVKYRLMGIDSLVKLEQTNSIKKALATAYGNLSHIYRNHLNDSENAIICAHKSLEFRENFEKNKSYGISLYNLGRAYAMNNEFQKSADFMKQALQFFKEGSNKEIYQKSVLEINLGIILSEFDKEKACILLIKSIETMQKDEISIYRTTEIDKRIKIGKNILKLNDEKL
ncbi:AAA family ATPase [bacterium]|nr:AAA family ATPase [bacterium]